MEWSEEVARIVEEALAAHRPRQLFGIQLGRSAPAPRKEQLAVAPAPQPVTAPPREIPTRARIEAFKQCYQMIFDQLRGRGSNNHPWVLVFHSRESQGALGMLDALETHLMRGGAAKMQSWLGEMSKTPDACVALSSILSSSAQVAADRMIGILLLTTDIQGGTAVVSNVLSRLAQGVDSSLHLAHFLETSSRHPRASRGLVELLGVLATPHDDDWSQVRHLAETFRQLSSTVGGSRRLSQMLENLSELEDASASLALLLQRLCRIAEGAEATLEMLGNLANDKEGAHQLSRVLCRTAQTRPGASDLLKAWLSMAAKVAGQREVSRLLVDLAEGPETARWLARLARETFNAYNLQYLLDQLSQDGRSRKMLEYALNLLANSPRQSVHFRLLEARLQTLQVHSLAS